MTIQFSQTLRHNVLDEITAEAGATAHVQFYSGAIPADPTTAGGTRLASCPCSNPIAGAAPNGGSNGTLPLDAISNDTNAAQSGTPTFFRIAKTAVGTTDGVVQGSAAISPGAGEDMLIDKAIVATGEVAVSSLVFTDGNS